MSDPDDPFDEDETADIVDDVVSDQVASAVGDAQDELADVSLAITRLTARLVELIPPAAVIQLVTSVAVGTAVKEAYE